MTVVEFLTISNACGGGGGCSSGSGCGCASGCA